MNKIKILHLYKTTYLDSFGGIENFLFDICNHDVYINKKIQVYILAFTKKHKSIKVKKVGKVIFILVPYFFIFRSLPISIKYILCFFKIKKKFNIFHIHYPFPYSDLLSYFINKKIIITYHSDIISQKYTKLLFIPFRNLLFKKAKHIFFTSETYLKYSDLPIKFKSKSNYINLSLNEKKFDYTESKLNFKKPYEKYFLFIGNFRNYKGLDLLIESFNSIDANLVIAGSEKISKNKIKNLVLKNNIKVITNLSDDFKNYLLKNSFCLILPSTLRSEAFGYVLLEASFYSKPLITFQINTGVNEINLNNYTGLVCENINATSLINAIKKLDENFNLAITLGQNAKKHYEKNFSYDHMILKYIESYFN